MPEETAVRSAFDPDRASLRPGRSSPAPRPRRRPRPIRFSRPTRPIEVKVATGNTLSYEVLYKGKPLRGPFGRLDDPGRRNRPGPGGPGQERQAPLRRRRHQAVRPPKSGRDPRPVQRAAAGIQGRLRLHRPGLRGRGRLPVRHVHGQADHRRLGAGRVHLHGRPHASIGRRRTPSRPTRSGSSSRSP